MAAAAPLDCSGGCRDYVLDSVQVPTTSGDAQKYSLLFKGRRFNAMGNILSLLAQQASQGFSECNPWLVSQGKNIKLMRMQLPGLFGMGARAQLWIGEQRSCCPSAVTATECKKDAATGCFSGSAQLRPRSSAKPGTFVSGTLDGKQLFLDRGRAVLPMSFDCTTIAMIPLVSVRITGQVSGGKITHGVLAGTIHKTHVHSLVMPGLARRLDLDLKGKETDKQTKEQISIMFDTDGDGTVEAGEVAGSALLRHFLAGDVDADGDGTCDLSVGVGFTAVSAKIEDK